MTPIINPIAVVVAAFIPTILGLLWYSPILFGGAWRKLSGTEEIKVSAGKFALFLIVSLAVSFFLSILLVTNTIHQMGVMGTMAGELDFGKDGSASTATFNEFMKIYGDKFRSYPHGALHGAFLSLLGFMPMFGLIVMRERKGWAYFGVHAIFWFICTTAMGALICGWRP
jgi:hypothetical protein